MSEEELSNVFEAHVLPKRMDGDSQLINISLFNPDGSPFALPVIPDAEETGDWVTLHYINLANGWGEFYDGSYPAQYRLRPDHTFEMRGMLDPGAEGSMAFTLPPPYRHDYPRPLYIPCSAAENKIVTMTVDSDGVVMGQNLPDGSAINDLGWVNLAAIRYSVD